MQLKDIGATWRLAWPIAVGQLATTGTAFVDTVMAGHVSSTDLAAVSVGSSIWTTLSITLLGYFLATSPMVAHQVGASQTRAIPNTTQQALLQALLLGVLALGLTRLIAPVFILIGLEADVAAKATRFLEAISWGLPAFAIYRALYSYSAALKHTKPLMLIAVGCFFLNIPANWVLIYGHLGFPALGGVGCGYATAFCVWVNVLALSAWIYWRKAYRDTHPFRAWRSIDHAVQKQLFKLGLPIGIMYFVEVSAFSLIALLIARLGKISVAAHQIALNFTSLSFMIPMAVGTALTVRVGHAVGAHDFDQARSIGQNGVRLGLSIAIVTGSIMIMGSYGIARFYTQDPAVIALAASLIVLGGFYQFSDITQVVCAGILRGYKITRLPMIIHMTAFLVVGIPMGYLLTFGVGGFEGLGVRGYWISLIVALTVTGLSLLVLFKRVSINAKVRDRFAQHGIHPSEI